ncbi:MAG TPA: tetratricopeptide repeat protein, partial [Chthoniobacterales bacterium]
MKKTSNVQRPTPDAQWKRRAWTAIFVLICLTSLRAASAENSELLAASRPLQEGVPQVAVLRLRTLLNGNLAPADRRAASAKLGEALLAAEEPEEALKVLQDPQLSDLPAVRFWRAQAFASLERWAEALPLYQQITADAASPFHARALFGQGESFRALGRLDEALKRFALLFSDERWKERAELRSIELLLDKQDNAGARRLLDKTKPDALANKKEKRFLQGRLEAQLNHRERALELFRTIFRRPEGATRAVLIATLCAAAETNLQLKTPEAGDDPLEDFIEHYPTDPALPTIFAKLDQLYRAEPAPSTQELSRWANDSVQPRRALAQWYLARSELRAGRSENASRIFGLLRREHLKVPALVQGWCEFAQLEIDQERYDEALAILEEARAAHPPAEVLRQIDLIAGRAQYQARHFETAARTFEKVA